MCLPARAVLLAHVILVVLLLFAALQKNKYRKWSDIETHGRYFDKCNFIRMHTSMKHITVIFRISVTESDNKASCHIAADEKYLWSGKVCSTFKIRKNSGARLICICDQVSFSIYNEDLLYYYWGSYFDTHASFVFQIRPVL